ncbi:MAG: tRNA pseudouridine(38-40) synthase TruA [Proteobacteria bacterium]|nr:tRNA pseudouridine(38-40) synthase TruA [Desulfobacula sp.]MBU3952046.1 tRNA pseudouridine(38-40) synthase TruA [Pseudomonadota bacterium]MBU4131826.1 tRNA pseudouridine(38-40) synthase TruA [Pseudomonadota bacterium]
MNRNYKLVVEYDGTLFSGWQRQKEEKTIQGELESVLGHMLNQKIHIRASGRTDAGVHALGQVANFHAHTQMDPLVLKKGVNSLINPAIVIRECSIAPDDFHAQYQARSKEYNYYILNRPDPCAIGAAFVWQVKKPLDLVRMNQCCEMITGVHDFKSFENTGSPKTSSVREVFLARVNRLENGEPFKNDVILFKISASGFLKNMVRNLMGTLVDVGLGKITPSQFQTILGAGNRALAGNTAPARGLFLKQVNYS